MQRTRVPGSAVMAVSLAVLLGGCGVQDRAEDGELPAFGSMDEAFSAVDAVLGCESDPAGEPIAPMDGGLLASEQRLCADNVQVDLYPDERSLEKSYGIWSGSQQGEVRLVRGGNWMVVDLTAVATGDPTPWDIEHLADELHGEYVVAGT
ncbi:hypothetical protein [Arthrobacter agilis]|uniref:hypothetical protein n=1 Tax=Arthrobacter agilis TaxID=37921 RepID=UPI0027D81FD8|nr:hypothetical protein [Arthrobacter agilis]